MRLELGPATARLALLSGSEYVLTEPRIDGELAGPLDPAIGLIGLAVDQARAISATQVGHRPARMRITEAYAAALRAAGFQFEGERFEYTADVDTLPGEEGSPLTWRVAALDEAAQVIEQVAVGDPHGADLRADGRGTLQRWMAERPLRGDAGCIQVGHIRAHPGPAALVVAQVNPESRWSRITHMGLVPELRGRGLGAWVHRHGFAMIRAQGGRLYHGGTAGSNAPMRRLFARHGCAPHADLQEWVWRPDSSGSSRCPASP